MASKLDVQIEIRANQRKSGRECVPGKGEISCKDLGRVMAWYDMEPGSSGNGEGVCVREEDGK